MQQVVTGVVLDLDGAPVSFTFENRHYLVSSKPVRWYSRKLWWQQAESAPRGVGGALVEVEMCGYGLAVNLIASFWSLSIYSQRMSGRSTESISDGLCSSQCC